MQRYGRVSEFVWYNDIDDDISIVFIRIVSRCDYCIDNTLKYLRAPSRMHLLIAFANKSPQTRMQFACVSLNYDTIIHLLHIKSPVGQMSAYTSVLASHYAFYVCVAVYWTLMPRLTRQDFRNSLIIIDTETH